MVSRTVSLAPASVFLALLALCPLPPSLSADSSSPPDALFPNEKALVSAAYAAIEHIHAQMDDDNSGGVDLAESRDFIQEELSQKNGITRHSHFHAGNDNLITVEDLWMKFDASAISKWTTDEVVVWLYECGDSGGGELARYEPLFRQFGVTGLHLPIIGANKDHFFSRFFGKGVVAKEDKKRLILKAQDATLFGECKRGHNWIKDIFLTLAVILLSAGFIINRRRQMRYRDHLEQLQQSIDSLTSAEQDLDTLQDRLAKEESARKKLNEEKAREQKEKREREKELEDSMDAIKIEAEEQKQLRLKSIETAERLSHAENELIQLRSLLKRAEKEIQEKENQLRDPSFTLSTELVELLAETFRREVMNYKKKKEMSESMLFMAKDSFEKVKKKKGSVMGNFRLAHSGTMDDVDLKMREAKTALEDLRKDLNERRLRWQQIEQITNINFTTIENDKGIRRNTSFGSVMSLSTSRASVGNNNSSVLNNHNSSSGRLEEEDEEEEEGLRMANREAMGGN